MMESMITIEEKMFYILKDIEWFLKGLKRKYCLLSVAKNPCPH